MVYRMSFVVPRYRFPSYHSCSCYIYGSDFSSSLGQCQSSFLSPNNYRAMALLGRLSVPSGGNVTNACSFVQSESRTEPDECHIPVQQPIKPALVSSICRFCVKTRACKLGDASLNVASIGIRSRSSAVINTSMESISEHLPNSLSADIKSAQWLRVVNQLYLF